MRLKGFEVYFQQNRLIISDDEKDWSYIEETRFLHKDYTPISSGAAKKFKFNTVITLGNPQAQTAIGRNIARYFDLRLVVHFLACTESAELKLHMIVHPANTFSEKINPPAFAREDSWDPKIFPVFTVENAKNFQKKHHDMIPFKNEEKTFKPIFSDDEEEGNGNDGRSPANYMH